MSIVRWPSAAIENRRFAKKTTMGKRAWVEFVVKKYSIDCRQARRPIYICKRFILLFDQPVFFIEGDGDRESIGQVGFV